MKDRRTEWAAFTAISMFEGVDATRSASFEDTGNVRGEPFTELHSLRRISRGLLHMIGAAGVASPPDEAIETL